MAQEAFCRIHGPYDAQLGTCPYCQREGQAGGTQPVGEDSTRVYSGRGRVPEDIDEQETDMGWRRGQGTSDKEEETIFSSRRWRRDWNDDIDATVVERRVEGLLGWLIVKHGGRRGHIFSLGKETTVGRKSANITLNDPKVSRLHAKLAIVDDHFVIVDVLSENGTFVNGERLQSERMLQENDEVRVGDTVMVLKVLPTEEN